MVSYFSERYTVCCGTVRYGALKNSDKFALTIVLKNYKITKRQQLSSYLNGLKLNQSLINQYHY
jgi:hypothetical protein